MWIIKREGSHFIYLILYSIMNRRRLYNESLEHDIYQCAVKYNEYMTSKCKPGEIFQMAYTIGRQTFYYEAQIQNKRHTLKKSNGQSKELFK